MEEKTRNTLLWIGLPFASVLTVWLTGPIIKLLLRLAFPDELVDNWLSSLLISLACYVLSGFLGVLVAALMAPKAKRTVGIVAGIVLSVLEVLLMILTGKDLPVWGICLGSVICVIGTVLGVVFVCSKSSEEWLK